MSNRVLAHAALFALDAALVAAMLLVFGPVPVLILLAVLSLPLVSSLGAGVPAKSRRAR